MNAQASSHQEINLIDAVSRYCDTALISLDANVLDIGLREVESIVSILQELSECIDAALTRAKERERNLNQSIQAAAVDRVVSLINSGQLSVDAIVTRLNPQAAQGLSSVDRREGVPVRPRLIAPYKSGIRYRDPVTGSGWSGRGRMPGWLTQLCVNRKTKKDFLVEMGPEGSANKSSDVMGAVATNSESGVESEEICLQMQQQAEPEMMPGGLPVQAWPDANIDFVDCGAVNRQRDA